MDAILARAELTVLNGDEPVEVGAFVPLAIQFPGAELVSTVAHEQISLDVVLNDAVTAVKELVGKITGTLPVPTSVMPDVMVLTTEFYSDDGTNAVSADRYRLLPTDNPAQFSAVLVPPIQELTNTLSSTIYYRLRVSIRLRMGPDPECAAEGTVCTAEKTIEKRIPFRRLGIPTVFAGFEHDDFGGAALIVVPDNSPLGSAGSVLSRLSGVLTGLSQLYDAVKLLGEAASWSPALPDLDVLSDAISHLPGGAVFRSADEIDELESITVVPGRSFGRGDADDFFDSVLFIGVDEKVQLFTDEGQDGDDPWFSITTPENKSHVAVLVDNLDSKLQSRPSNRVTEHGDDESFHDALSSLRFRD